MSASGVEIATPLRAARLVRSAALRWSPSVASMTGKLSRMAASTRSPCFCSAMPLSSSWRTMPGMATCSSLLSKEARRAATASSASPLRRRRRTADSTPVSRTITSAGVLSCDPSQAGNRPYRKASRNAGACAAGRTRPGPRSRCRAWCDGHRPGGPRRAGGRRWRDSWACPSPTHQSTHRVAAAQAPTPRETMEYTTGAMFFLDARAARVTWTVIVFAADLTVLYLLRTPLLLFVFSLFFAYLIFPLVRLVERGLPRRAGRALAIGIVYLLLLLALVGVGLGVGPRLTDEVTLLTQKAPEMSQKIGTGQIITDLLRRRGWEAERVGQVEGAVRAHAGQIIGYVQRAVAAGLRWLAGAWVIVLVPVFAFFILKDAEPAAAGVDGLIEEPRHRALWRDIAEDVHLLLGKYVRALILLSLITFVAWSAVFFLAGMPYPVGLAAIAGALEFLPIVGPLTAGVIVVGVALFSGYAHPWLLVAFVLVWRGIQAYVSSPLRLARDRPCHARRARAPPRRPHLGRDRGGPDRPPGRRVARGPRAPRS